ncbi:MAG: hypothetical protein ACOH2Q_22155 [Rhodococcus sp. (in: high G+C Gram-positive bacteria)]
MKTLLSCGVYTVLLFAAFVLFDDVAVWKSAVGAAVAGALFALLTWLYQRRAPAAESDRFVPNR